MLQFYCNGSDVHPDIDNQQCNIKQLCTLLLHTTKLVRSLPLARTLEPNHAQPCACTEKDNYSVLMYPKETHISAELSLTSASIANTVHDNTIQDRASERLSENLLSLYRWTL